MSIHSEPFVSFVIPTYNAQKYLDKCLASIRKQDYPKDKMEILVIDGGSTDETLSKARNYNVKILENPFRDAESGKSIGIQASKGEIIALVDADNELVEKYWLKSMVTPLIENSSIFGVESPWYIKKGDPSINQYVTLLRIADPVARRLHPKMNVEDRKDYIIYSMQTGQTPVVGANGFLWRKKLIKLIDMYKPKFEEVNYVSLMVSKGFFSYARVKNVGIYHNYCTSIINYIKKRLKIGRKFMQRKEKKQETWVDQSKNTSFILAVLYNISIILPLIEAINEYKKTKNIAWFWHPFISLIAVLAYAYTYFEAKIKLIFRE